MEWPELPAFVLVLAETIAVQMLVAEKVVAEAVKSSSLV
jgi:hypothetical protein